jgi:hypothetical protein
MRYPFGVADVPIISRIALQRGKGRCIANRIDCEGDGVTAFGRRMEHATANTWVKARCALRRKPAPAPSRRTNAGTCPSSDTEILQLLKNYY